ncbi:MAG: hypothetical protein ACKODY_10725 [Actinomycetota bacterium]
MTINEQQRVRLHQSLERQIGEEMAGLLMSSLPPFDWNQIATKDDLKVFATREEINIKFAQIETKFAEMRTEFHKTLRVQFMANVGLMATFMGIFLAKI